MKVGYAAQVRRLFSRILVMGSLEIDRAGITLEFSRASVPFHRRPTNSADGGEIRRYRGQGYNVWR